MYIVFIIIGAFLILIGLMVWILKIVEIIAGYDSEKVIDKDGLARWVGRNLVLMGTLVILLGFIQFQDSHFYKWEYHFLLWWG